MTFAAAMAIILGGGRVCRPSWKGTWIGRSEFLMHGNVKIVMAEPFLFLSDRIAPWLPSQADFGATDWIEVK